MGFISKHIESLDNLLLTLKSHHSGDVHRAVHDLWPHFYKEHAHHNLGNLTKKKKPGAWHIVMSNKRVGLVDAKPSVLGLDTLLSPHSRHAYSLWHAQERMGPSFNRA